MVEYKLRREQEMSVISADEAIKAAKELVEAERFGTDHIRMPEFRYHNGRKIK